MLEKGTQCPCCAQWAQAYRRKVNAQMASTLIYAHRAYGRDFGQLQDVRRGIKNREESKLRYWGLLVEEPERRPDGGKSGWWAITDLGEQFVLLRTTIPKYALVYNNRCLKLYGEPVSIIDALGTNFNYRDLMDGI